MLAAANGLAADSVLPIPNEAFGCVTLWPHGCRGLAAAAFAWLAGHALC